MRPPRKRSRAVALGAGPIRERRTGQHDRAEVLGRSGAHDRDRPTALAITDHDGLVGIVVQLTHVMDEDRLDVVDVGDGLARYRLREKRDQITLMPGPHRHPDLAVFFKAADARTVSRARIDDDVRPLLGIDGHVRARLDFEQRVVRGPIERPAVQDHLRIEGEQRGFALRAMLEVRVAALAHDVEHQPRPLHTVEPIVNRLARQTALRRWGRLGPGPRGRKVRSLGFRGRAIGLAVRTVCLCGRGAGFRCAVGFGGGQIVHE